MDNYTPALEWLDLHAAPLVWSFRIVAACAATFVLLSWLKYRKHAHEIPPHNRQANEAAWALAAMGAIIGGVGFNTMDVYWISVYASNAPNATVATVWGFWAAALTYRASARAEQPRLIWAAAGIILAAGLFVISVSGRAPV